MLRDVVCSDDRVRLPGDPLPIQLTVSGLAGLLCAAGVVGFIFAVLILV